MPSDFLLLRPTSCILELARGCYHSCVSSSANRHVQCRLSDEWELYFLSFLDCAWLWPQLTQISHSLRTGLRLPPVGFYISATALAVRFPCSHMFPWFSSSHPPYELSNILSINSSFVSINPSQFCSQRSQHRGRINRLCSWNTSEQQYGTLNCIS